MFFNPFPWWFILFVAIPMQIFSFITYLPYYILYVVGLGKFYKRMHHIAIENLQQFTLQPKDYLKHVKSIHKQIVEDSKRF